MMLLERQKELQRSFETVGLSITESEEALRGLRKLITFVDAYDKWLELFMQDAREDLEDDGSLEAAVQRLDAARKALEVVE